MSMKVFSVHLARKSDSTISQAVSGKSLYMAQVFMEKLYTEENTRKSCRKTQWSLSGSSCPTMRNAANAEGQTIKDFRLAYCLEIVGGQKHQNAMR